jgi:hypothetical protein
MSGGNSGSCRAEGQARRLRDYAALLAALTALFALRVAAQAIQCWAPQPFLPPFDEFQGSALPYGILLSSQLIILAAMAHCTLRVRAGTLRPARRAGNVLAWLGGVYMGVSLFRIAIGLTVPGAGPWFSAWIPATLHVVLAAFVVTLAYYHVVESLPR